jgi:hypothetical protein
MSWFEDDDENRGKLEEFFCILRQFVVQWEQSNVQLKRIADALEQKSGPNKIDLIFGSAVR